MTALRIALRNKRGVAVVPTPAPITARINAMVDAVHPFLCQLADRWADEYEYEDFAEYATLLKSAAEQHSGVHVQRMSKRPFSFDFTIDGAPDGALYRLQLTKWTRIA